MSDAKTFYNRYWKNQHIKVNPFDHPPGEWTRKNFDFHLNFFRPYVKGKLLDFGCGDGQFLYMISKYCESAYGIDISEVAVENARKNYPDIHFSLLNNKGNTDFQDNFFDTICAIDVFEHILDIESILEEIYRILKPGGNLLIATNELTRIKMFLIILYSFNNYFYPTSPHIRYFTRKNLEDILKLKGFKMMRYKKNRTYFGFIPRGQMVVTLKTVK